MGIRRRLSDFLEDAIWVSRLRPRRYSLVVQTDFPGIVNRLNELRVDAEPETWLHENVRGAFWVNTWSFGRYEILFARKADMAAYILANAV